MPGVMVTVYWPPAKFGVLVTLSQETGGVRLAVCWSANPCEAAGQESMIALPDLAMVVAGGGMTVKVALGLVTLPEVLVTTTE